MAPDSATSSSIGFLEGSREAMMEWNTCANQEVEEEAMHTGNTAPRVMKRLL